MTATWTTGYAFPTIADESISWDAFREGFKWDIPDVYNISSHVIESCNPESTALRYVGRNGSRYTYAYGDLDAATGALAARLSADGIGRGDSIGVCLPQCPEQLLVHLAAYRLGAVVVPMSMLLGDDSLRYALEHSGATMLVIDNQRTTERKDSVSGVTEIVVDVDDRGPVESSGNASGVENEDEIDSNVALTLGGLRAYTDQTIESLINPVETSPADPALILYTSGTTGKPKGVTVPHRYLIGSLPAYHCYFHLFTPNAVREANVWTPSEWAWAGALFDVVFPTLALGGTVVARERRSRFDPDQALELVESEAVTHGFLPPTALRRIRTEASLEDRAPAPSLSVVMCGGEKLPPSVFRWAEDFLNVTVNESYGQTEANGLIGNCRAIFDAKAGSMGRPFPGHDVAILDEFDAERSIGECGQLAVRLPDPVRFLEYWGDPDATDQKLEDGWLLTGDLVRRDEEGYLWHEGRMDDLIITSGYRVSPLEVERTLSSDSIVGDAVVVGVPDDDRGERIRAYIVLDEPVLADESAVESRLRTRVRDELGIHKVPHEIVFVESFPETRSGKTDRSALFDSS